jgi:hypothetical protein
MSNLPLSKMDASFLGLDKSVAVMGSKMDTLVTDVKDIKQKLEGEYATKEWVDAQYGQTRKMVTGIAGIILTAVVIALVALVIKK